MICFQNSLSCWELPFTLSNEIMNQALASILFSSTHYGIKNISIDPKSFKALWHGSLEMLLDETWTLSCLTRYACAQLWMQLTCIHLLNLLRSWFSSKSLVTLNICQASMLDKTCILFWVTMSLRYSYFKFIPNIIQYQKECLTNNFFSNTPHATPLGNQKKYISYSRCTHHPSNYAWSLSFKLCTISFLVDNRDLKGPYILIPYLCTKQMRWGGGVDRAAVGSRRSRSDQVR